MSDIRLIAEYFAKEATTAQVQDFDEEESTVLIRGHLRREKIKNVEQKYNVKAYKIVSDEYAFKVHFEEIEPYEIKIK